MAKTIIFKRHLGATEELRRHGSELVECPLEGENKRYVVKIIPFFNKGVSLIIRHTSEKYEQ